MIQPCCLLTAAVQLSQDVAWVDQEVPVQKNHKEQEQYKIQIPQTTDGLLRHDRVFLWEIAKPVQADQCEGEVGEHNLAKIIVFNGWTMEALAIP